MMIQFPSYKKKGCSNNMPANFKIVMPTLGSINKGKSLSFFVPKDMDTQLLVNI
jgi:hypothetical protein